MKLWLQLSPRTTVLTTVALGLLLWPGPECLLRALRQCSFAKLLCKQNLIQQKIIIYTLQNTFYYLRLYLEREVNHYTESNCSFKKHMKSVLIGWWSVTSLHHLNLFSVLSACLRMFYSCFINVFPNLDCTVENNQHSNYIKNTIIAMKNPVIMREPWNDMQVIVLYCAFIKSARNQRNLCRHTCTYITI